MQIIFTATIKGNNLSAVAVLLELQIQCGLLKQAFKRLSAYAKFQTDISVSSNEPRPQTPLEVVGDCTIFLSAAGVISKLLFPRGTKTATQNRGRRLRELLEIADLPNLASSTVRNSFEHIDERLDRLLSSFKGGSICPISVARERPEQSIVLKRFDPNSLSILFLDDAVSLESCYAETLKLEATLPAAFDQLRQAHVALYNYDQT